MSTTAPHVFRRALVAAALGGLLLAAASPAALAQTGEGGDSREVAVGTDAGNIDYNDTPQAPDQGTTVSVGGDSNLGVPQPNLVRVPDTGDGIFAIDVSGPAGATVTPEGGAPPAGATAGAAPTDAAAAPAEGAAPEAPPVPTCADYPTWYDAQIALESAADPALAASLDPDGNGIACEEAMG